MPASAFEVSDGCCLGFATNNAAGCVLSNIRFIAVEMVSQVHPCLCGHMQLQTVSMTYHVSVATDLQSQ